MGRIIAIICLVASCIGVGTLFITRYYQNVPAAKSATVAKPSAESSALPKVRDFKAGMVINGATVLSTADLSVDWAKWKGRPVIIRGTAYNASDQGAALISNNVILGLSRIDSETLRWLMKECHDGLSNPACVVTISGVPEDGKWGREIAKVQIMR